MLSSDLIMLSARGPGVAGMSLGCGAGGLAAGPFWILVVFLAQLPNLRCRAA